MVGFLVSLSACGVVGGDHVPLVTGLCLQAPFPRVLTGGEGWV